MSNYRTDLVSLCVAAEIIARVADQITMIRSPGCSLKVGGGLQTAVPYFHLQLCLSVKNPLLEVTVSVGDLA